MSVMCEHGLFVGVDRYSKLARDQWLTHAAADTVYLHDYFRRARPEGDWRVLSTKGSKVPKRVDILSALYELVEHVPKGQTGLFYFSGHASVSTSGLVLKSYDTHDVFPNDTGLPLARAMEILKSQASANKRFFVVLDCCREGISQAAADNLPPNVCVLYACQPGNSAYEMTNGGILTRSIIESLEAIALETRDKACSIRSLCNRLGRQLFTWRPSSALTFELYGNWADQIYLPVACRNGVPGTEQRTGPSAVLRYCFGSKEKFEYALRTLGAAIFNWYGISYKSKGGQNFVNEHFLVAESIPTGPSISANREARVAHSNIHKVQNYFFEIHIPDGCARWTSSDFLVHLLNVSMDNPQTLILSWPKLVEFAIFKEFQHVVDGEWQGAGVSTGPSLIWKNTIGSSQYRGLASMSSLVSGKTSVCIACETIDPFEMPLSYLLPTLRDVYDLFRFVTV
jgi:Caspase domain